MQADPDRSRRPGPAVALLCGLLFVGSALLVLCSSYRGPDGNQRVSRSLGAVRQTAGAGTPPPQKPVAFLSAPWVAPQQPAWSNAAVLWGKKMTLRGQFRYEGGRLVVPSKGRYRVYFQLSYLQLENSSRLEACKNHSELILTQKLVWVRKSYPDNTTLLQVQDTAPCNLDHFMKTLQASAAFDLTDGDLLYVQTNHPGLLHTPGYLGADLEL